MGDGCIYGCGKRGLESKIWLLHPFVIFHIFVVKLWLTGSSAGGWPRFISRSEPRRRNLHCSTLFPLYSRVWSVLGGEQKRPEKVVKKERRGEGNQKTQERHCLRNANLRKVTNFRVEVDARVLSYSATLRNIGSHVRREKDKFDSFQQFDPTRIFFF